MSARMTPVGYSPSHVVPEGGLDAWSSHDLALPVAARLDARLDVQVVEWWGDWALVRCSNDWSAWVDGRYLEAIGTAPTPPAPRGLHAFDITQFNEVARSPAVIGAAAILVATLLPWIRIAHASTNSFKLPIPFLLDYKRAGHKAGVISIGTVLLLCSLGAIGLSAAQAAVRNSVTVRRAMGGLVLLVDILFVLQLHRLLAAFPSSPSLTSTVGAGFVVALGAGIAVVASPPVGRR